MQLVRAQWSAWPSDQREEYDALVGEDKILSFQLTQRNQELGSVYAKIKAHWSILQRGESCYAEKATELRLLTKHVQDKQRKGHDSALQMISIKDLHQTHLNLERKLLHERHKNKALRDKLERPINVHRWRILESSDPQRFEMLKAINNLQKQIILKTGEILEKDSLIQNKEGAYIKLKKFLSRQHGQEATGQAPQCQKEQRRERIGDTSSVKKRKGRKEEGQERNKAARKRNDRSNVSGLSGGASVRCQHLAYKKARNIRRCMLRTKSR